MGNENHQEMELKDFIIEIVEDLNNKNKEMNDGIIFKLDSIIRQLMKTNKTLGSIETRVDNLEKKYSC